MGPWYPEILCPVDLSAPSRTAFSHAMAVAAHFKARLLVLAVRDQAGTGPGGELRARLERFVVDALAGVQPMTPEPQLLVLGGAPGRTILEFAIDQRVDLIVLSTHGAGGDAVCGSTCRHLLQHARTPLLLIPAGVAPAGAAGRWLTGAQVVLAPVDFHARAERDARIGAGIAAAFGLPLLLLHAHPADGEAADAADGALAAIAQEMGSQAAVDTMRQAGDPAEAILRTAGERNAGLIVMGLHGRPDAGTPPGRTASHVIPHAPVPVLALPEGPTLRELGIHPAIDPER